jgi:hypothetical protein
MGPASTRAYKRTVLIPDVLISGVHCTSIELSEAT